MIALLKSLSLVWKLVVFGIPALIVSHGLTFLVGDMRGRLTEKVAVAQATAFEAEKHAVWLVKVASLAGLATEEFNATELTNEQLQKEIENAFNKPPTPGAVAECLPADFLHQLARLR